MNQIGSKQNLSQQTWEKVDVLFDEYLDSSSDEQLTFFDRKQLDSKIQFELEKLISALDKTDNFIETPTFTPVKEFLALEPEDNLIGKKIGAYRLERLIGRGGMCAVYLASRIDDFEKQVAIKIIPPFETRKQSAENFRRERQILARLEHPNIAQILDGGTTADNTPYLVMEYVDGLPLNEFCTKNNLNLREKLTIFQSVCQAVTFAHQNLIVHRDLKPNNILVTKDGKVKLLDFGIAKLLNTENIDFSENKTIDGIALTPEYASPEQLNGENITTASDVYSLGIILYELLTEKRPFNFKGKSLKEILKISLREEPISPSQIQDSKSKIQNREIDLIVLKALAKSPSERYQTVEDLRTDIFNYLNDLPISVRPQTSFYQFEKYVKRHKFEAIIATVFILILLGWLVTALVQRQEAQNQAKENRRTAYSAEMILAANEYENANLNRLREIVEKYQPQNIEEDLRGFEWYFLNNLLNPSSKIKSLVHTDEIWNVEFSPDGKSIVTVSNDNFIRIWNIETGEKIETVEQKGAWKASFFPDGKHFAISSSSNSNPIVKIYETTTAKEILTLKGHDKRVRAVDVSPDGKIIATGSQDGSVRIWDAETGAETWRFQFGTPEKGTEFYDVQFSKNGDKLAVSGFETFAIFDTKTWEKKQIPNEKFIDKNVILNAWKLAFSPLEKTIALGMFTGEVVFIDVENLEILRVLKLHQSNVKSVAFSSDGKILATGSWDRIVKFIDVQTGETVNELRGHFAGIHEVAFSPDSQMFATASGDFRVNIWNSTAVLNSSSMLTAASFLQFSNDAKQSFSWNNSNFDLVNWDLAEKKKKWAVKQEIKGLSMTVSEATKKVVFGERDGSISIFDYDKNDLKRFKVNDKSIFAIASSQTGDKVFIGDESGVLRAINSETGTEIFSAKLHSDIIKIIIASPNGKIIATGANDKLIKIIDIETGQELKTLIGNTKPLYKAVFSTNGEFLATGGADDIARIWRVSDGKLINQFSGMSGGIFGITFSPDGRRLATASDVGVIRLWNTETGEQVLAFTASQKQINNLKFSEDGKTLISVDSTGKMSFWQGENIGK